jgi:hypothetical protein
LVVRRRVDRVPAEAIGELKIFGDPPRSDEELKKGMGDADVGRSPAGPITFGNFNTATGNVVDLVELHGTHDVGGFVSHRAHKDCS